MYWFVLKSVLLIASFVDEELHLITHYRVFAVKIFDKALVVATDKACRDLIKHHETMLTALEEDPAALVAAATAHCSALASPESVPETMLSLRAYQLDPSFLWAPFDARDEKLMWAYNAAIAQLAAFTQPFLELPDDCAGDVLEYLNMDMARSVSLHIASRCSSPEAHAWVRRVIVEGIAVR